MRSGIPTSEGNEMDKKRTTCERCGGFIDKGACGQAFGIVTVKDDRENDPAKFEQRRFYLCEDCIGDFERNFLHELDRFGHYDYKNGEAFFVKAREGEWIR